VRRGRAALALLAAAIVAAPLAASSAYALSVLNIIGLYAIVTVGLVVLGCAGQVSLGQAAFYGLGAYTSAALSRGLGWSPLATLPLAVAGVAASAFLVGLPTLRLADHFFVLATVAFGIIVNVLMVQLEPITGGGNGLRDIPALGIAGARLVSDRQWYYLIWACAFGALVLARNVTAHRTGRALRAILGSEVGAAALGIDAARYKMQAFVLSAAYAALAGALYAHYIRFVSPSPFSLYASLFFLIMAVVGGLTSVWGGLVGAALVTVLDQAIRAEVPRLLPRVGGEYQTAVYGLLLVVIMLVFPRGIASWWGEARRGPGGRRRPAEPAIAGAGVAEEGRGG
jgi:branched-chain amino acid transport system permease protein